MKRLSFRPHFFLLLSLGFAPELSAQMLAFETDRFGYTGAATRYNSLDAARAGGVVTGGAETVTFDRGVMSIFVTQSRGELDLVWQYPTTVWISPAFFYTYDDNTNGYAKDDDLGDRYHNGLFQRPVSQINLGNGAHLLVDNSPNPLTTSLDMSFGGYNAGVWDTFSLSLSGRNVNDPEWGARFALDGGITPVPGVFREYSLEVTAIGVQGTVDSEGQIRSAPGHPTGVEGTFSGIFQKGGTSDYYAFTITLDMVNHFFDEYGNPRNGDLNGNYGPSIFTAPIPEPATYAAMLAGLTLLVVFVRRVRAQRAAAAA